MLKWKILSSAALLALLLGSVPSDATNIAGKHYDDAVINDALTGLPYSSSNPFPIVGTISASLGGFTPSVSGARMTPLTVTVADSSGLLPTGAVAVISNAGTNPMYCNVNGVAATTSDQLIAASSWFSFTIPGAVTTLHCIATGGSTTANGLGGAGLATGAGGGGGGGSGGTVTQGTAAAAAGAWPTYLVQGTTANASGNPIFAQITAGAASIGTIGNTSFGISGTLPAFAATPTVNSAESGTWTVQPGNTANTTAWLVTGTGGTFPLNATPSLANGNGVVPTQGGAVLSATNGMFTNLLQGNAVIASGNPLFTQLTAGAAVIGALTANQSVNNAQVNGVAMLTGAGATGTGAQRVTAAQDTTTIAGSAPGTAGSASTNVMSVQGIASMTPLLSNPGTAASWGVGATGSAVPANGVLGMASNAGTAVALQGDATSGLWVNIKAGAGSGGTAAADKSAWTVSTTNQTPAGCEFTTGGATALTTGQMGTVGCTAARGMFTDKASVGGTALTAAVSAYGTPPTGTAVEAVNAFVTNTLAGVGNNADTIATTASPNAGSPVINYPYVYNGTTWDRARSAGATGVTAIGGSAAAGAAPSGNPLPVAALSGGATGGLLANIVQADSSAAISVSTATTTQIVALSASRKIYVTSYDVVAAGTGNITFEYGTGASCGTGTTVLTGAYNLTAQAGIAKGNGLGPVLVVPAGNALCVLTTAAVQMSGSVAYAQF